MDRPLWADLHNHNSIGYGQGSLDRSYEIARGTLLDVYCFTPHGRWHDMPTNDPKIVEFHKAGFERVRANWERIRRKAEEQNQPGEFVSLLGFEWHSSRSGDYHVILPASEGELCDAASLEELRKFCQQGGAIMIPHHIGYRKGWRGANWGGIRGECTPVVDVFSEHGCAMESEFNASMLLHSMGGVERSQTFMAQLGNDHRCCGVVGSTDNHWGHPASYGEGLAGIWAEEISRSAVLTALRSRHSYAVTGDRISLLVESADGMMGDILGSGDERRLRCRAVALGGVDYVRVFKNGRIVHSQLPPELREDDDVFTVRIDFGWGAMTDADTTVWEVEARVSGGAITGVFPCFAGGPGSIEKVNRVAHRGEREVRFEAFTSRANSRPQSGLVLRISGERDARIELNAEALWQGRKCGCRLAASVGELLERDQWAAISEVFSAPRIRLGQCHGAGETDLDFAWQDPDPGTDDWYLLKLLQKNGQAAWSSPMWFSDKETTHRASARRAE
jgi:Protein of unknown function (DUF3604)